MVIYTCTTCNKSFNRKSNYDYHIENKKNPCRPHNVNLLINPNLIQINPNLIQTNPNLIQITPELPNTKINIDNDHTCNYCNKSFYNGANLNKHIKYNCTEKKEDDKTKQNIFELLLEKERKEREKEKLEHSNQLQLQNNEISELKKQLTELTKNIKELTEKTNISKSNNNINNNNNNCNNINNITNIIIPSDKLAKFGKEDLSKITQNDFLKITQKQGYGIFMECAKLIYNSHSSNQTVYVADVSRKKAMIWDNNQWVLSDLEDVLYIIKEKIRDLYNINLDTMEDKRIIEDFEKRVQKYFDMLYDEYDEDKKDDKKFIKRVQNMQNKFEHNLIKWLFNIKQNVLNNYNTILDQVYQNTKQNLIGQQQLLGQKMIALEDCDMLNSKKGKGRPKSIAI